jgi:hypothetical protein
MAKPKDKKSLVQDITNRYRVTAREARDIVTAVGTLIESPNVGKVKQGASNLKKQIAEVGPATQGKKGTTSDKAVPRERKRSNVTGNPIITGGTYTKGQKRK